MAVPLAHPTKAARAYYRFEEVCSMQPVDGQNSVQPLERAIGAPLSSTPRYAAQIESVEHPAVAAQRVHATETLKVSTRSRPSAVAGAIAGVMRERGEVDVQAIGAGATNQAVKAVAIACNYLRDDGINVCCVPAFIDVMIDGEERTAVRLLVQHLPD